VHSTTTKLTVGNANPRRLSIWIGRVGHETWRRAVSDPGKSGEGNALSMCSVNPFSRRYAACHGMGNLTLHRGQHDGNPPAPTTDALQLRDSVGI
jgi:hypothetical protein